MAGDNTLINAAIDGVDTAWGNAKGQHSLTGPQVRNVLKRLADLATTISRFYGTSPSP